MTWPTLIRKLRSDFLKTEQERSKTTIVLVSFQRRYRDCKHDFRNSKGNAKIVKESNNCLSQLIITVPILNSQVISNCFLIALSRSVFGFDCAFRLIQAVFRSGKSHKVGD